MQQRPVGSTGLKVSRLALGLMTWGSVTDEHEAREQLTAFADAGGTFLDTAHVYGGGASEELLGQLLAGGFRREDLVIATKAGFSAGRSGPVYNASRGALLPSLDL